MKRHPYMKLDYILNVFKIWISRGLYIKCRLTYEIKHHVAVLGPWRADGGP